MAFGLLATTSSMDLAETERSLYERLGGYDAISAVVDVFLDQGIERPGRLAIFCGHGHGYPQSIEEKNTNLMCASTGAPCKTINRPLAEAHVGLGITDKEFDIVAGHLGTTLKKFKIPQK